MSAPRDPMEKEIIKKERGICGWGGTEERDTDYFKKRKMEGIWVEKSQRTNITPIGKLLTHL